VVFEKLKKRWISNFESEKERGGWVGGISGARRDAQWRDSWTSSIPIYI
jgi:hypothetical protein